jgi:acetyltransferase-like isoleucine patch superfamily enzyme
MKRRITQYVAVHRYPEYVLDMIVTRIVFVCWRCCFNFRIGRGARMRGLPIVSLARGSSIRIGKNAYLISRSRNTALGVNHAVVIRTLRAGASICIGDHFSASGVTLCAASAITIGDRVMVGANATIVDTDFHAADPAVRFACRDGEEPARTVPVVIGDDVFIGMNATILKGVSIGRAAIIGAGAVVTADVPADSVVAGNPARIVKRSSAK